MKVIKMPRMRHLGTIIAAIIIAPLAWLLLAFGQDTSLRAFADHPDGGSLNSNDFLRPLLFLAAAGLLLGLIATLRFSPLGAVLTGIVYAGSYALLLAAPERVLHMLPKNVTIAGWHADTTTPLRTGTTVLVGALLLVALVSVGRWQRWPDNDMSSWDRSLDEDRPTASRRDPRDEPYDTPERTPAGLVGWASSLRGGGESEPWTSRTAR